jgi:cation transport regulator ChaB
VPLLRPAFFLFFTMLNSTSTTTDNTLAEAGAKHTRAEYEALETKHELLKKKFRIMQQAIRMIVGLYGNSDDISELAPTMQAPAAGVPDLGSTIAGVVHEAFGAQNIADYLVANTHREFTMYADDLLADGAISQDSRIALSHAIGVALDTLNATIDSDPLLLCLRSAPVNPDTAPDPAVVVAPSGATVMPDVPQIVDPDDEATISGITASAPPAQPIASGKPIQEAARASALGTRELRETVLREAYVDDTGKIDGVIVAEGLSLNGNYYTQAALQSGLEIFKGKPIYIDHPSKTEEADRPERSVRDLVGRIAETYLGTNREGKPALRHKSIVSKAEQALLTKVGEGIAGDMSINATGSGSQDPTTGNFVVEAFTDAVSLDFVTRAAAGGDATLVESARGTNDTPAAQNIHEEASMPVSLKEAQRQHKQLIAAVRAGRAQVRKLKAEQIVAEALGKSQLPLASQARIRALLVPAVTRFAEAGIPKLDLETGKKRFQEARRKLAEAEGDLAGDGSIAPTGTDLEPGDQPTVEIPPDVAELPADAQALWLSAYTDALPQGAEQAVHIAWAAVFDAGYYKDDSGVWQSGSGATPASTDQGDNPPMSPDQLQASIGEAIKAERQYLASVVSSAGRVQGMGGELPAERSSEELTKSRIAAFMRMGLTEAQAKTAVQGRA